MATLTVVVSAFNEEEKIRDCLESVKWADEIIFIDNSSTDSTSQIVKKYTSKIHKLENNPLMLNVNKNYGIGKVTKDWVLYLDADERVTPALKVEIKNVIARSGGDPSPRHGRTQEDMGGVNGFWIPRKNIIFGKWMEHSGMYPDYQMRLFRKGKGKFPQRHVHEMIEIDGTTTYLENSLVHYNFETISQFLYKHIELYAPNEAEGLLKRGYRLSHLDAIRMPMGEFLSRFFAREGYRDGLHGLMLSLLWAFYHFVIFAKIWEKERFKEYNSSDFLDGTGAELKNGFSDIAYWIANEKLKRSKNLLEKTLLRFERKLKS